MDALRQEKIRLIEQELERRQQLNPLPERQQKIDMITAELGRRGVNLEAPREPVVEEPSLLDKALQIPRGLAKSMAAYSEAAGPQGGSLYAPEYSGELREEQKSPEGAAKLMGEAIDKAYGKSLEPTDEMGKMREDIGAFLMPMPIPGSPVVGAGLKGAVKGLGRLASGATGASAAINLTPKIAEEGTAASLIENLAKGILGTKAGTAIPGAISSIGKTVASPVEFGAAKLASTLMKPEEHILEKAAKHRVELPFNVGSNSTLANYVANNYLKSIFTSKKYKDSLNKSSDSMINSVKRQIDTLGPEDIKPTQGSSIFREAMKEEELVFKKKSDELYDTARKSLKKTGPIVPRETLKALDSEAMRDLLSTISPSASEKAVINRINSIKSKLGEEGVPKAVRERYKDNPKYLATLEKHLAKRVEVPVSDLINLRKSLLNTLNYETDIRGSEAFLSKLTRTIDKDIKSISDKEALNKYETANRFFSENIGQRFRTSLGKSIIRNEIPVDAYNLMNSVQNVKRLEKIAGENPKSRELFDSLKKAKVREILGNAVEGNLSSEGTVRNAAFSKLFQKGEKRQELLEYLLGKKQYDNLSEIAEIANEFSKSGRELLNTSGTAHTLSDLNATKDVAKETIRSILFFLGGTSAAGPLGLASATGAVMAPNIVSRLAANPKFVARARAYALARQRGQDKYANTLLRPLIVTALSEVRREEEE